MKKVFFIAAVAAAAAFGVMKATEVTNSNMSALQLENVELLAEAENPDCPNGCHLDGPGCVCYGWHWNYLEHNWKR